MSSSHFSVPGYGMGPFMERVSDCSDLGFTCRGTLRAARPYALGLEPFEHQGLAPGSHPQIEVNALDIVP